MYLMHIKLLLLPYIAQATMGNLENSANQDALTIGGAIIIIAGALVTAVKVVIPAVAARIAKYQGIASAREEHDLEMDKKEGQRAFQTESWVTDYAKSNMELTQKRLTDLETKMERVLNERQQYYTEMVELRAAAKIGAAELLRLTQVVEDAQLSSTTAKQILIEAQRQIEQLSRQVDALQKEVERLTFQYRSELEINKTLTFQLESANRNTLTVETELNALRSEYNRILREKDHLIERLLEYRELLEDDSDDPENILPIIEASDNTAIPQTQPVMIFTHDATVPLPDVVPSVEIKALILSQADTILEPPETTEKPIEVMTQEMTIIVSTETSTSSQDPFELGGNE